MIRFFFLFFFIVNIFSQEFSSNFGYELNKTRRLSIIKEKDSFDYSMILSSSKNHNFSANKLLPIILKLKYNPSSFYDSNENLYKPKDNVKIPIANPLNYNDGSMIPNVGFQQLLSFGFYFEYGPLSVQVNPEYLYAENKPFQLFWTDHQLFQLDRRYDFWNKIDQPERFGQTSYSKLLPGQSSIRFNFSNMSIGFSTENLWWGPGIRNGIMLSNNARGFPHITFNSVEPLKTKIGNFEWQFLTGRLEKSGFMPSYTNFYNYNDYFYLPKKNDWRYFQGLIVSYSPSFIDGLTVGFSRWVQAYSTFIKDNNDYFPVFDGLFRKNDKYGADLPGGDQSLEQQRDQAAGLFFRWVWKEAKAEIYAEFAYNDSKFNARDLLLDFNHSLATTMGFKKILSNKYDFSVEVTKIEQNSSSILRDAGSWYQHGVVRHGFTNYGEVLGASIGPGSKSFFTSISKFSNISDITLGYNLILNNNDFLYKTFENPPYIFRKWETQIINIEFYKKIKNLELLFDLNYIIEKNLGWMDVYDNNPGDKKIGDFDNFALSLTIKQNL